MDTLLTAELAASAPRYRRKSSTFIDGIHDVEETEEAMAPAQLYSTMSGRLFHSGRIAIIMVGLPARGKTHISVSVTRYLQWLGVKTRIFHLGDYRRATVTGGVVPEDYFFPNASPSSLVLRQKIMKKCREDIYSWLDHDNGQVAIYDAVNPTADGRRAIAREFARRDIQTLFIESWVDDKRILHDNARNVKISSPDFRGMDPDEAAKLYLNRIEMKIPCFENMNQLGNEKDLNFIRMINAGQKFYYNNVSFNYVSHRIVFFLTNLHVKTRCTYFARAGHIADTNTAYRSDAPLDGDGRDYAQKMAETLVAHRLRIQDQASKDAALADVPLPSRALSIWTSPRLNTIQTAEAFQDKGFRVRQRSQMSQINPGVCENMTELTIRDLYPGEVEKHEKDPYHHRYPRSESYHDLAVRLEPIILELEREQNDLLIIAHESVLRVLYAYLMHCSTMEIPTLEFNRDEIIEVIPAAYQNEARRIPIPGLSGSVSENPSHDVRIPEPAVPMQAGGDTIVWPVEASDAGGGGGGGDDGGDDGNAKGANVEAGNEASVAQAAESTNTPASSEPAPGGGSDVPSGPATRPPSSAARSPVTSPVIRPIGGSAGVSGGGSSAKVHKSTPSTSTPAEMVADKVDDED